ncbi:unnamed protein product [Blepharisma stoltei]|uniref:Uncharacterized protein n=1 Tax=Blepharisma stoltei TaxID=1481888 RepID=A0AAU9JNX8_9CILI|nr:unnamed protein product [Blepharisma stoltei]
MEDYLERIQRSFPWHYDTGVISSSEESPLIANKKNILNEKINLLLDEYKSYITQEIAENAGDLRELSQLNEQIFEIQTRAKIHWDDCGGSLTCKWLVDLLASKILYVKDKEDIDKFERKIILQSIEDISEWIKTSSRPEVFIRIIARLPIFKQKCLESLYKYLIDREILNHLVQINCKVPTLHTTERSLNFLSFLITIFSFVNLLISIINSKEGESIGIIISSVLLIIWIIFSISLLYDIKSIRSFTVISLKNPFSKLSKEEVQKEENGFLGQIN